MKRLLKYFLASICLIQCFSVLGQDELVKTKSLDDVIMVKWFPAELLNAEGFNVFRSTDGGSFEKLNDLPIKLDPAKIQAERDEDMKNYMQMAESFVSDIDNQEPILKFYMMVKSIMSDEFALFIGNRYNDTEVEKGKQYVYRVERVNGNEVVGTSEPKTLGVEPQIAPPQDAKLVFQSGSRNTFTWVPETDRYFAVNAYRRRSDESNFTKMNSTPIVPGKVPDEFGIIRYPDYFFEDTLLTKASYYYQFKAIDAFGDEGLATDEIFAKSIDNTPPAEVSEISFSNTDQNITVSWRASRSNDVAGYNVFRSFNGDTIYNIRNVELVTDLSFVDPIDRPGTYMYRIGAVDEAGNTSLSEIEYIIVSDLTPPPNPGDLRIEIQPGEVRLSWSGEQPGDFWGYKVMRSDKENPRKEDFQLIIADLLLKPSFTNILAGESEMALYYAISSVDTFNNESEWLISEMIVTPDTVSPQAPVIIDVETNEDAVSLKWIASPDLDVVGYEVLRCEKSNMDWVSIDNTLNSNDLQFIDNNPTGGKLLCYKIVAKDDAGNVSQASNVYTIKSKAKDISGEQRINLSVSKYRKNKKQVELEWEGDKDFQYRGYMVFRSENEGKFSPASAFLTATTYEDKAIQENTNYQYQIKAYTDKGVVLISNIQTITIK